MIESMALLKASTRDAMTYAKISHEAVLAGNQNALVAASYANAALAKCSLVEALYYTKYEDSNIELEVFFLKLHTYVNEVLRNIKDDHSHQWSDLEYHELEKQFQKLDF